jgi:hypothetical protein
MSAWRARASRCPSRASRPARWSGPRRAVPQRAAAPPGACAMPGLQQRRRGERLSGRPRFASRLGCCGCGRRGAGGPHSVARWRRLARARPRVQACLCPAPCGCAMFSRPRSRAGPGAASGESTATRREGANSSGRLGARQTPCSAPEAGSLPWPGWAASERSDARGAPLRDEVATEARGGEDADARRGGEKAVGGTLTGSTACSASSPLGGGTPSVCCGSGPPGGGAAVV